MDYQRRLSASNLKQHPVQTLSGYTALDGGCSATGNAP